MPETTPQQPNNALLSAEERQRRIEEQTSVGKYTMKQIKQEGILAIGAVAGYFAARGMMRNSRLAQWVEGKVITLTETFKSVEQNVNSAASGKTNVRIDTSQITDKITEVGGKISSGINTVSRWVFSLAGALAGTFVAGIVNAYEHWKNLESEKLAVSEINKDVGNLVNERAHFADTLNRQETLIKEMVAKGQEKGTFADRASDTTPSAPAL
jgi:hypothetical protein